MANGMLLGESRTTGGTLTYLYDESGVMYGFALNGTNYYYLHNGRGDVIGLVENGQNQKCCNQQKTPHRKHRNG